MARDFTGAQKKIVDRYYEHRDTIMLDRLGQIVSDIYLTESSTKLDKLWQTAAGALEKVGANPAAARKVIADKNVEALARLVNELTLGDPKKPKTGPASSSQSSSNISSASTFAPVKPAGVKPTAAVPTPAGSNVGTSMTGAGGEPSAQDLKMALKAFRKRLKLTKLDEESRVGRSPLSSGQKSDIVAIEAPRQYPLAVWEALVEQGKLKRAGRGFYQLVPGV